MTGEVVAASKFLSYVLRHSPAAIGVELDEHGWIDTGILLAAAASHGRPISTGILNQVLNAPGKQRFESRGTKIRAAHGHSVPVDLQLEPSQPPPRLYHGTIARFLPAIRAEGLKPGKRTHVHMSADPATAADTAARRGHPVILIIDAAAAHQHGHLFYQAANGTWLTSNLLPRWIIPPSDNLDLPVSLTARHATALRRRRVVSFPGTRAIQSPVLPVVQAWAVGAISPI